MCGRGRGVHDGEGGVRGREGCVSGGMCDSHAPPG